MTKEEIMVLGHEELEERKTAIGIEIDGADEATIAALEVERELIEERKRILDLEIEEQRKAAEAVAAGAGKEIEVRKDDKRMDIKELRNTPEYIKAYAKYVQTGSDKECRAVVTELVDPDFSGGKVPVPTLVDSRIRAAWDRDRIFERAAKSYARGILKVGFEKSSTGAELAQESYNINEEELTFGIVSLTPQMVKKFITVSDEALAIGPEELLTFLYDEFSYRIVQKVSDLIVSAITSAPGTADDTRVAVAQVPGAVTPANIIQAIAQLGDNARDLVFIASGQTIADVKTAALTANYQYDPFMGLTVIAKEGVTGAIIGDLSGVQVNLPEGGEIKFKFDDLSMAEYDMVKIVGRLYAGIGVVGPKMFAYIDGESPSAS